MQKLQSDMKNKMVRCSMLFMYEFSAIVSQNVTIRFQDSSELRCVLDDAIKPVSQQVERLKNELSAKTSQQVEMENHLLAETRKQIEKLNHDLFADMRGEMEKIVLAAETQNKDLLAQLRSVDTSVKAW